MAAGIHSKFTLQRIKTISAHTYADLASAPLILGFQCDDTLAGGWSEIAIHTDNPALTAALVKAINDAVASVKPAEVEAVNGSRAMEYFVVMIDYGRRGREAIVDPEITERGVIDRIASGEYDAERIAFIHHIHSGICEDVTERLVEAGKRYALQAAE